MHITAHQFFNGTTSSLAKDHFFVCTVKFGGLYPP